MPNSTDRQALLKSLEDAVMAEIALSLLSDLGNDDDDDNNLSNSPVVLAYLTILQSRYLATREPGPRGPSKIDYVLNQLDANGFRQELRMERSSFFALRDLIKDYSIFESDPHKPQTDVTIQRMVALEQLGFYGNGASVGRIARDIEVSHTYA
ncbi:hypothetical protein BJV82DRAFT_581524 [Fennellomyces sp. T-0311]|nr:hypothetical protein BJV82DRAFT_581524 [Fennellomyces sp. T-0311]